MAGPGPADFEEGPKEDEEATQPEVQFVDASEIARYLSQRYRELEDGPEKSTVAAGLMTFWCGAEVNHVSLLLEGARASIQMIPGAIKPQRMN